MKFNRDTPASNTKTIFVFVSNVGSKGSGERDTTAGNIGNMLEKKSHADKTRLVGGLAGTKHLGEARSAFLASCGNVAVNE